MRSSENQADHFDVCAFEDSYPKDVVLHYHGLEMIASQINELRE